MYEKMDDERKGKATKGHLRASSWVAYSEVFRSEDMGKANFGYVDSGGEGEFGSIVDRVGGDGRILKILVEGIQTNGGSSGVGEMEKAKKLGRGVYEKGTKKQVIKSILELITQS